MERRSLGDLAQRLLVALSGQPGTSEIGADVVNRPLTQVIATIAARHPTTTEATHAAPPPPEQHQQQHQQQQGYVPFDGIATDSHYSNDTAALATATTAAFTTNVPATRAAISNVYERRANYRENPSQTAVNMKIFMEAMENDRRQTMRMLTDHHAALI